MKKYVECIKNLGFVFISKMQVNTTCMEYNYQSEDFKLRFLNYLDEDYNRIILLRKSDNSEICVFETPDSRDNFKLILGSFIDAFS